jgi:hypothetical protein
MSVLEVLPSEYHSKLTLNRHNIFRSDSYLSKSALWEFFKGSPYKWQNHPKQFKSTEAMKWGSLVDCLTTAPEDFDAQFTIRPDTYTDAKEKVKPWNGNSNTCKQFIKEASDKGLEVITTYTLREARKAAHNLLTRHKESAEMFANSDKQVILHAVFEDVNIKGLADLAPRGKPYLSDLKTTGKFSMQGFERTTRDLGYHVQAGLYLMLWNAQHPDDQRDRFRIVWQDSSAPYEVAVTEIPALDIAAGQDLANYLIDQIISCAKVDLWPMKFEQCVMQNQAINDWSDELKEIDGYTAAPTN